MMKMHLEDADLLKELKMENEQLKKKLAEVCMRMCLYTYTVSGSCRKKFLGGSSQIFVCLIYVVVAWPHPLHSTTFINLLMM